MIIWSRVYHIDHFWVSLSMIMNASVNNCMEGTYMEGTYIAILCNMFSLSLKDNGVFCGVNW